MSSFSTSFFALDPGNTQLPAMDNSDAHAGDGPDQKHHEQSGSWQRLPSSDSGDLPHPDNGTAVDPKHHRAPADEDIVGQYQPGENGGGMLNSDPPRADSLPRRDEDTPIPDATAAEDTKSTTFSSPQSKPSGPKKKKKGTAAVVKAPKRATTSAAPGGASRRGKKGSQPGGAQQKSPDGVLTRPSGGGGDGSESDSGPYCICRGPDNHRFMISCDRCEDWFHGECIGMDKFTGENLIQSYICPSCSDGGRYVTRYKKMCALDNCSRPARIYDPSVGSIFCSDDHAQAWWEQLIATLPKSKAPNSNLDFLTQQEFMGLLESRDGDPSVSGDRHWKLGQPPLGVPPDFWTTVPPSQVLTPEELSILSTSASDRHDLGEEIILGKRMLQLLDMASKRRDLALSSGSATKDLCGYDPRLDTVGTAIQFRAFFQSPHGESIFSAGKLGPLPSDYGVYPPLDTVAGDDDALMAGMCARKKCKPHGGWNALLVKNVRHRMKELAAQARELASMEERVRRSAAGRFQRRGVEENTVEVFDSEDDLEMAGAAAMTDKMFEEAMEAAPGKRSDWLISE